VVTVPLAYRPVPVQRKHRYFGFYLSELLIIASCCLCYGLYDFLELGGHNVGELFFERAFSLFSYYVFALPITLLLLRLSHLRAYKKSGSVPTIKETVCIFRHNYLRPKLLVGDFRALLLCVALFILFIELKHLTPFLRSSILDTIFIRQEHKMFGGALLSELVLDFFGTRPALLFSEGYFLFYPYVAALIYLFVLQRNERLREEFLLGFSLCWIIGVALIFLIPTVGPVYVTDTFLHRLPRSGVYDMQLKLLAMRESVLAGRGGVHLISGFPSLHVVVTAYGTWMLWRIGMVPMLLSAGVMCVTLITTLYFGWHYMMDDVGGLALGFGIAFAVQRYFRTFVILTRG
jgi:membrane-associated phospholipid phosphatase